MRLERVALGTALFAVALCGCSKVVSMNPDSGSPSGTPDGGPVTEGCPPQCPPPPPAGFHRSPADNPIPAENALAGDPAWRSGRQANQHQLELYASVDSVEAGDTFAVKVSADGAHLVVWEMYATLA